VPKYILEIDHRCFFFSISGGQLRVLFHIALFLAMSAGLASAAAVRGLRALAVRKAEVTHPTGNPDCSFNRRPCRALLSFAGSVEGHE
jgi:hypothetical protein